MECIKWHEYNVYNVLYLECHIPVVEILDLTTHKGEYSYHSNCIYQCDTCTLRAVHITYRTCNIL